MRYKKNSNGPKRMPCPRCYSTMGGVLQQPSLFMLRCATCGHHIDIDPPASNPRWFKVAQDAMDLDGVGVEVR